VVTVPLFGRRKQDPVPTVDDVRKALLAAQRWDRAVKQRRAELERDGHPVCVQCSIAPAIVQYAFQSLCKRCYAIGIANGTVEIPEIPVTRETEIDEYGEEWPVFIFHDDIWVDYSE
jgi:hypothetical protein